MRLRIAVATALLVAMVVCDNSYSPRPGEDLEHRVARHFGWAADSVAAKEGRRYTGTAVRQCRPAPRRHALRLGGTWPATQVHITGGGMDGTVNVVHAYFLTIGPGTATYRFTLLGAGQERLGVIEALTPPEAAVPS